MMPDAAVAGLPAAACYEPATTGTTTVLCCILSSHNHDTVAATRLLLMWLRVAHCCSLLLTVDMQTDMRVIYMQPGWPCEHRCGQGTVSTE